MIAASKWASVIESKDLSLKTRWAEALITYALEVVDETDGPMPEVDDDDTMAIFEALENNSPPPWWPTLGRVVVITHWEAEESNPESSSPAPIETAHQGGFRAVHTSVLRRLASVGIPFEGSIRIEFQRRDKGQSLGGASAQVYVSTKKHKSQKKGDDGETPREKALWRRLEQHDQLLVGALGGVANVVHAAAAVVNASAVLSGSGDGEDEGLEEKVLGLALNIANKFMDRGGENDEKRDRRRAQKVLEDHTPALLQLTGPEHDFTGPPSDEFNFDEEVVEADWSQVELGEEEGEEEEEEEEEGEEEREEPAAPLAGMTTEQIMKALAAHIDDHPEDQEKIKKLGIKHLVPKLI